MIIETAVPVIDILNAYRHEDAELPKVADIIDPLAGTTTSSGPPSAFYSTALAYLLYRLETKRPILTGQVTEQ